MELMVEFSEQRSYLAAAEDEGQNVFLAEECHGGFTAAEEEDAVYRMVRELGLENVQSESIFIERVETGNDNYVIGSDGSFIPTCHAVAVFGETSSEAPGLVAKRKRSYTRKSDVASAAAPPHLEDHTYVKAWSEFETPFKRKRNYEFKQKPGLPSAPTADEHGSDETPENMEALKLQGCNRNMVKAEKCSSPRVPWTPKILQRRVKAISSSSQAPFTASSLYFSSRYVPASLPRATNRDSTRQFDGAPETPENHNDLSGNCENPTIEDGLRQEPCSPSNITLLDSQFLKSLEIGKVIECQVNSDGTVSVLPSSGEDMDFEQQRQFQTEAQYFDFF